jgi:hypothetical protein
MLQPAVLDWLSTHNSYENILTIPKKTINTITSYRFFNSGNSIEAPHLTETDDQSLTPSLLSTFKN